jgi:hypothetical protein
LSIQRKKIALAVGRGLLQVLRFSLYVLLLLIGRVLRPIASAATIVGLIIFLFCLVFRRDMATPMWAGAALSASAVVVTVFYEALLRLVAPAGVVIISDV